MIFKLNNVIERHLGGGLKQENASPFVEFSGNLYK